MNSTPSAEDAPTDDPTGRQRAVNASGPGPSRPPWLRWAVVFYGILAGLAFAWSAWSGAPWAFADAQAERDGVRWIRDGVAGALAAAAVIALTELVTRATGWGRALAAELGALLGRLSPWQCLALAALSGFAEELFFRGALQPRIGWLWATLCFGLAHVPPNRALWPWTGFALLAGGGLGALFHWTGNLVAPVVAHAGINAVNLHRLSRRHGR